MQNSVVSKVNYYDLNNQQLKAISCLEKEKNITIITSSDKVIKEHLLLSFVKEMLIKGKTFILRTQDQLSSLNLFNRLKNEGLGDLTCILDGEAEIDILKQEFVSDAELLLESLKSQLLYQRNLNLTQEIVQKYTEPVFGDYPRTKLAELMYLAHQRNEKNEIDLNLNAKNYLLNQQEFWNLRGKIDKASKHYKTNFSFLYSNDEINFETYKDFHLSSNRDNLFLKLQKFINEAEEILKAYQKLFQKIKQNLKSAKIDKLTEIRILLENFKLQMEYYELSLDLAPKTKSFIRKKDPFENQKKDVRALYSLLLQAIDEFGLIKLNAPNNSWVPEVENLKIFCLQLKIEIEKGYELIQNQVQDQIEIINSNNFDSQELKQIVKDQNDLNHNINLSKIFKKEFQNLSISAWKNFENLKNSHSSLKKNLNFLTENNEFAVYRSFEYSLDKKALEIIKLLENVPQFKWVDQYELWYFNALYNKFVFPNSEEIRNRFDNLFESKHECQNFDTLRIKNIFDQHFHNNEKSEKNSWKNFIDKKENENFSTIPVSDLVSASKKVFKSKFPLLITSEQNVNNDEYLNLNYDYLICLENKIHPDELISGTNFSGIGILQPPTIEIGLKERLKKAENYIEKKKIDIQLSCLSDNLSNISFKSNLKLAKSLASIIKEISYEKVFYSAKDFSIISCLSPFCTKLLAIEFQEIRIKTLKYSHIDSGILEDVLLKDDKFKILLVQDGFLDPKMNIEWQISVLRKMEQIGIKVIRVNTFELGNGTKNRIMDFIDLPEIKLANKKSLSQA